MEQGNYTSYEESVIKYKPGPKSKKKTFYEKNNEDSKKPEPKTNKDFSEDEIPDFSENEISTNNGVLPLMKRNEIGKFCPYCKHNFPKFGDRELKKHKPRCEKWHTFVEADNKTCKLCEKTYSNNGLCLFHFESQKCPRKKILDE